MVLLYIYLFLHAWVKSTWVYLLDVVSRCSKSWSMHMNTVILNDNLFILKEVVSSGTIRSPMHRGSLNGFINNNNNVMYIISYGHQLDTRMLFIASVQF